MAVVVAPADESLANTTSTKSALHIIIKQFQVAWFMYINERMNRRYAKTY